MKISNFVISIVIFALLTTVFGGFYAHIASKQGITSYDNSTLEAFNQFEEINNNAKEMNRTLTSIEQGNAVDLIGGLLTSGYTVIKTTWASFGAFNSLMVDGVQETPLGDSTSIFLSTGLLVVLLLFMFAMISILVKSNV